MGAILGSRQCSIHAAKTHVGYTIEKVLEILYQEYLPSKYEGGITHVWRLHGPGRQAAGTGHAYRLGTLLQQAAQSHQVPLDQPNDQ